MPTNEKRGPKAASPISQLAGEASDDNTQRTAPPRAKLYNTPTWLTLYSVFRDDLDAAADDTFLAVVLIDAVRAAHQVVRVAERRQDGSERLAAAVRDALTYNNIERLDLAASMCWVWDAFEAADA